MFMDRTYKSKYYIVKKLSKTFRLIDDITTLNSDGYLEEYYKLIYPATLILNKESEVDTSANVLDLEITINKDKFLSKVYDTRDSFKFDIVQFQPIKSNKSCNILYGTFYSQIIRYSRICNDIEPFAGRVKRINSEFIKLRYKQTRLRKLFAMIVRRHDLGRKFGDGCRDILLL